MGSLNFVFRVVSGHGFSRANGAHPRRAASAALVIALLSGAAYAQHVSFRDITLQAGIHFIHNNAAFGKKYLPETMGPGCAFIDYDNDGYPDVLLVNGQDWPGHAR